MTLEEGIRKFAAVAPDKTAVVCRTGQVTYAELHDAVSRKVEQMKAAGLKPHTPYVYRASQDTDFIVTYCAVHTIGAIAVPLGHDVPEDYFESVCSRVKACSYDDDIVDILFTTGTTGNAKGVMLSQTCLDSCAENFIVDMGFSSDLAFIISGPLNHIASLFKIHPMLTIGGTVCVVDGMKDLNAFYDIFNMPFDKFGIFLVPSTIRMLLQFSFDRLSSLSDRIDIIETGTAPMMQNDMVLLSRALPDTRLYNTLGGTEIGCVCTYNFNDGIYKENCVGRPMKNSSVEISEEGDVIISGRTVMSGYVGDEEATRAVMADGKIHGSDLGYWDEDGMLRLRGRRDDVINVGGYKVDPAEIENAAASHPCVKECICIASAHPIMGNVLKLLVVLHDGYTLDKQSLAAHLKERLEGHKVPFLYEATGNLKRMYNGKLDRKSYR